MPLVNFKIRPTPAFTLIELLVVITIIVVLLAMLAPSMEQAVYQARLTMCTTQLDAYGTAMIAGATERRGLYPKRTPVWSVLMLNLSTTQGMADDRPLLREHLGNSLNPLLVDPLTMPVDLDNGLTSSSIYGSYALWHNWELLASAGGEEEDVMMRLGDRWSSGGRRYNILAQDLAYRQSPPFQFSSHPDGDGVMRQWRKQDEANETDSLWIVTSDTFGPLDLNVLYQDGAVARYHQVPARTVGQESDDRFTTAPFAWRASPSATDWIRVPKR